MQRFAEAFHDSGIGFFSSVPSYPSDLNHQANAPFVADALGGYNHMRKVAENMFQVETPKQPKNRIPSDIVPRQKPFVG